MVQRDEFHGLFEFRVKDPDLASIFGRVSKRFSDKTGRDVSQVELLLDLLLFLKGVSPLVVFEDHQVTVRTQHLTRRVVKRILLGVESYS